jgi:hypothetical protein
MSPLRPSRIAAGRCFWLKRALLRWWETSGRHIRRRDLPIRSLRVGDILVSMIALETIDLRGLDARGRPNSPLKKPS